MLSPDLVRVGRVFLVRCALARLAGTADDLLRYIVCFDGSGEKHECIITDCLFGLHFGDEGESPTHQKWSIACASSAATHRNTDSSNCSNLERGFKE